MQVPSDLVYHRKSNQLEILYATGQRFLLPAEYLRVMSPSAEVQGHSPEERKLQVGKRDVTIVGLEPVGSYAVKIIFSDGHNSGYYDWDYLYQLACDQIQIGKTIFESCSPLEPVEIRMILEMNRLN